MSAPKMLRIVVSSKTQMVINTLLKNWSKHFELLFSKMITFLLCIFQNYICILINVGNRAS